MDNNKFTPGPWYAESGSFEILKHFGKPVAEATKISDEVDNSQRAANAQLIAAAPEMHEALKNVWERVEFKNYPDEMRQLVERALTKANGS